MSLKWYKFRFAAFEKEITKASRKITRTFKTSRCAIGGGIECSKTFHKLSHTLRARPSNILMSTIAWHQPPLLQNVLSMRFENLVGNFFRWPMAAGFGVSVSLENGATRPWKIPTIHQKKESLRNVNSHANCHAIKNLPCRVLHCVNGHINCMIASFLILVMGPREVHLLHGSMISNYLSLAHISHSLKAFLARNQFEYQAIVTEAFNVGRKSRLR